MKNLILSIMILTLCFSTKALSSEYTQYSLDGAWVRLDSDNSNPQDFIEIDGKTYFSSQQKYIFPDGELSHTIDQSMTFPTTGKKKIEGSVDFFDSRGCSFKDLPVKVEFIDHEQANFLVTVPRYKRVTISAGSGQGHYRPVYCQYRSRYTGRAHSYICDHEYVRPTRSRTTQCRLEETVEVPIRMRRL